MSQYQPALLQRATRGIQAETIHFSIDAITTFSVTAFAILTPKNL
jgi:hypothetical protein